MRSSTRAFLRASGFGLRALHGYVYLRWVRRYVRVLLALGKRGADGPGGRFIARRYHGKVLAHEQACKLVTVGRDVSRALPEQVVPFSIARQIVLSAPLDIVAFECACRHVAPHGCQPTRVCMIVGRPMTDFILEHHPQDAQRLTQAEAIALLEAERARGHVHTAWFKDAVLNRFYAICNCCKCCCAGIKAMHWGAPVLISSGYVAQIDASLCAHCGTCAETCAFDAINGPTLDWTKCLGCGACEATCATGAIRLVRDERKGAPLLV